MWKCKECGCINEEFYKFCSQCGSREKDYVGFIEKIRFCINRKKTANNIWLCSHCGVENELTSDNCKNCGNKRIEEVSYEQIESILSKRCSSNVEIKCPICNSNRIVANKKGYSAGKGLLGVALTGGIGLLAGFIGSGKIKITCLKCGHSWKI